LPKTILCDQAVFMLWFCFGRYSVLRHCCTTFIPQQSSTSVDQILGLKVKATYSTIIIANVVTFVRGIEHKH